MRSLFLFALVAAVAGQTATAACPKVPDFGCSTLARDGAIACSFTTTVLGKTINKDLFCKPVTVVDPTKILGSTCDWLSREKCTEPSTPCAEGTRPTFTNCCPDCKVPVISNTCQPPPDCSAGQFPKLEQGCLTCKIPVSLCTPTQFTACQAKELPSCAVGEKPVRNSDCCLSCQPVTSGCGSLTDLFSRTTKCATEFSSLPECAVGSVPKFNTDTCCLTCRVAIKPPAGPVCTLDEFKACMQAVTECAAGETPTKTNGCCMSCRRPERKCSFIEAVKDCSTIPVCGEGEKPAPVVGSCCASCRPQRPRPTCSPVCGDNQLCVRTKTGTACRDAPIRNLALGADAAIRTVLADKDRARTAILEMVQRFCDKPENAQICTLISKLRDRLVVKSANEDATGMVSVSVAVADDEDSAGTRRLLEDSPSSPGDLLNAASGDAEARGNIPITDLARVCPREPSKENCAAAKDATFTQECKYYYKTFFCKPLTSIPVDTTTPPMTCTWEKMKACSTDTLPPCPPDTRPKFDYASCCPSCKFTKPTTEEPSCPVPSDCATGVSPSRDDKGCLTCKVPITRCTETQYAACKAAMPTLATCTAGEKPVRTPDCCISCKPAPSACGLDTDSEGLDRRTACATDFKALPVCATGTKPEFNRDTCCLTCRPQFKPPAATKCTLEEFKTCIAGVHNCETGEEPVKTDGCCQSCRRPERKCELKDVVENCRKVPECGAGEKPVRVEGSCCPSCRPTKNCAKQCAAGEKCRRVKGAEVCKKVKARMFKLAWGKALANLSPDQASDAIKEIVNRFCDRADHAPKMCDNQKELVDNIIARITARQDAAKTADVEVDVDATTTRRLLQLETDLLDAALKDSEASGDFEFTVPGAAAPTENSVTSSSTAAGAGAAALFLPLLLL